MAAGSRSADRRGQEMEAELSFHPFQKENPAIVLHYFQKSFGVRTPRNENSCFGPLNLNEFEPLWSAPAERSGDGALAV